MSGTVLRVDGPVVEVSGLDTAAMLDLVEVGAARLPGEVIALVDGVATVQVYEYTGGLRPGEEVVSSGRPLTAELGPGLLGGVFDGMLRRLADADEFLAPGGRLSPTLAREPRFEFAPRVAAGAEVGPGAPGDRARGRGDRARGARAAGRGRHVEWVADAGPYGVDDVVARVGGARSRSRTAGPSAARGRSGRGARPGRLRRS